MCVRTRTQNNAADGAVGHHRFFLDSALTHPKPSAYQRRVLHANAKRRFPCLRAAVGWDHGSANKLTQTSAREGEFFFVSHFR